MRLSLVAAGRIRQLRPLDQDAGGLPGFLLHRIFLES
jgi:hypothetical protein